MSKWPKTDEYGIPGDIPLTRRCLLGVATRFNIYFLVLMTLIGAGLFIAGVVGFAIEEEALERFEELPEPVLLVALGMICFSLFFPFFMALYFGRHFLRSVMNLEDEIARLKTAADREETDKE